MRTILTMAGAAVLALQASGCATPARTAGEKLGVDVEAVSSREAWLAGYWAEQGPEGPWLRGKLAMHPPRLAPVPGRLVAQLIDGEGEVVGEIDARPKKPSVKAHYALFAVDLSGRLDGVARVRLVHLAEAP